ncbi:GMC oxidoreductase-domain-containing protein [Hygrophoropsis aurantiaca]|uniref:GMC oxidoreductase-domain-containing protein n=1 Tax=Hygrophoropsis aurantiaca TaxID=72124 RepID=A0ACB8A7E3_9AGAM|nr:GMC oxidoreductase-domain-containing protein [Hygrophoropsis aurantiaca]
MTEQADQQFDVIFAGGGTAACVAAGRLAAADPFLKVLILEAGKHTLNQDAHTTPFMSISHLAPTSTTVTFHVANPSEHLNGRAPIVPTGRCVGGGSCVNFQIYARASASDYDDWETIHGNSGWGSKDLIPLLRKTETYRGKHDGTNHGDSGPLKVSRSESNVGKQFLEVAQQYDPKRGVVEDVNDLITSNAYSAVYKWIDAETGKRQDAAHYFVYNQQENKNLQILDGKRVKRVVIEKGRAVGVEYVNDIVSVPGAEQHITFVKALRLLVVSAGTFGSPSILERSGVGASVRLKQNNVQEIVDLPGVGENFQDHNAIFLSYLASEEAETLDPLFRREPEALASMDSYFWQLMFYEQDGKGPLATNGIEASLKLRPNSEEVKELEPAFQERWESFFAEQSDKPLILTAPLSGFVGDFSSAPVRNYISVCYFAAYPKSTGRVHIRSGDDANVPPEFIAGYLSDPADLAPLRYAYKKTRELIRRMGVYRGEYAPNHPHFPEYSAARGGEASGPVNISDPDIVYSEEDDKVLDSYHRDFAESDIILIILGTCAMKPREKNGVVDCNLNVYGVERLKVADLSIAPANVGSNTYSTALLIGEKAAVIIAKELGIKGVV